METVASEFKSIELDHSLFEVQVDGVQIWERLRFDVFAQITRQNGRGESHTSVDRGWQAYARGAILFGKNLVYKNPYFANESDILYLGMRRRKEREDGYWWDIYCDPIHEACDYDYIHFEEPYLLEHKSPARTTNLRYLDLITVLGELQQLVSSEPTIPAADRATLKAAEEVIQTTFGAEIDLVSMAREELHDRRTTLPLYRLLLDRVDPELVVVMASYGRETFIEACKTQEIPVVELQHGVIYDNHFGYSYPGPRTKETFPDYLLTFGEFWTKSADFPIPDSHVIPVGYPYLEQSANAYDGVESTEQLLFISQGTIGEGLSKFAVAVDQHPQISHDVVYKLHPGEYDRWQSEYPWLAEADIDVIDSSEPALYQLFAESTGQVGVYSTAIYEGLYFGLETYLYDHPDGETLHALLDDGVATQVSSADQLGEALDSETGQFDSNRYFAPNATDRICETIATLRAKHQQ